MLTVVVVLADRLWLARDELANVKAADVLMRQAVQSNSVGDEMKATLLTFCVLCSTTSWHMAHTSTRFSGVWHVQRSLSPKSVCSPVRLSSCLGLADTVLRFPVHAGTTSQRSEFGERAMALCDQAVAAQRETDPAAPCLHAWLWKASTSLTGKISWQWLTCTAVGIREWVVGLSLFQLARKRPEKVLQELAGWLRQHDAAFFYGVGDRIMGRFNFEAPGPMNVRCCVCRVLVIAGGVLTGLFGQDLPEAERYLRQAQSVAPQFALNQLYLAEVLLARAKSAKPDAKAQMRAEAHALLKVCCWLLLM
jgi:hypothetical protein